MAHDTSPLHAALVQTLEALEIFTRCSYPVSKSIDNRGYAWSEAYLDEALPIARKAITAAEAVLKGETP